METWPEAVNWLLCTYTTNVHIQTAVTELMNKYQGFVELEMDYSTHLDAAETKCGDIHSPYKVSTFFIEGLLP